MHQANNVTVTASCALQQCPGRYAIVSSADQGETVEMLERTRETPSENDQRWLKNAETVRVSQILTLQPPSTCRARDQVFVVNRRVGLRLEAASRSEAVPRGNRLCLHSRRAFARCVFALAGRAESVGKLS